MFYRMLLLGSASVFATATMAHAQAPAAEGRQSTQASADERTAEQQQADIIVTGSRLITNGNAAPTPVTVLSNEKLLETTPSTIPNALNRLPQFAGNPPSTVLRQGAENTSGAYLNLRQFGANRNLVLLDGNRVPPTASTGAVDTNVLPQALIKRVEIVTGGASSVYGSDAVTGVINFILDKDFNGLKGSAQGGISTYGDNKNWKFDIVGGTDLFDGRGHIVASYEHFDSHGVDHTGMIKRPGVDRNPVLVGAGTTANPFRVVQDGRQINVIRGGLINFPTDVPELRNIYFPVNGVPAPFRRGTAGGADSDGDYLDAGWLAAPLLRDGVFARFDYELTDHVRTYVQGSYNKTKTEYDFGIIFNLGANVLSGNPYIPASIQSIMTANNVPSISLSSLYRKDNGYGVQRTAATVKNRYISTGLEGEVFDDKIKWRLNYGYSKSTQIVINRQNPNNVKWAAALDAVVDPASGRIVCQVSLTPDAGRFPGCQPFNPFGPTAASKASFDWLRDETSLTLDNVMHDVSFSASGSPFSLWAGPVQVSVNAEYRYNSLRNTSSDDPAQPADCTGLRPTRNCGPGTVRYAFPTATSMFAKQNVKEAGFEMLIPLLADQPFAKSIDLSLAGRYTDYSTSGTVKTWKIGGSWSVNDDLRIRASHSKDIRAPTLNDLFAPRTQSIIGLNDIHTGIVAGLPLVSQGNPNLVPEVAKTTTVGLVYQPGWLRNFSLAIDYYDIKMANAIVSAGGDLAFQRECENSNGTSPYCALLPRPLPFSDRTAANFPTRILSTRLNAAKQWTRGVDVEANYNFDLENVIAKAPGNLALRLLASYQPVLRTQTVVGQAVTEAAGVAGLSKLRINLGMNYSVNGFNVAVTGRWQSKQQPSDRNFNVDLRKDIPAYTYADFSLSYRANVKGHEFTPFFTVENVFNKSAPITGETATTPGLVPYSPDGYDTLGRMFTAGVRFKL